MSRKHIKTTTRSASFKKERIPQKRCGKCPPTQKEIDDKLWGYLKEHQGSFHAIDMNVARKIIKDRLHITVREIKKVYMIGKDELPFLHVTDSKGRDLGVILTGGYYNAVKSWDDVLKEYPLLK